MTSHKRKSVLHKHEVAQSLTRKSRFTILPNTSLLRIPSLKLTSFFIGELVSKRVTPRIKAPIADMHFTDAVISLHNEAGSFQRNSAILPNTVTVTNTLFQK